MCDDDDVVFTTQRGTIEKSLTEHLKERGGGEELEWGTRVLMVKQLSMAGRAILLSKAVGEMLKKKTLGGGVGLKVASPSPWPRTWLHQPLYHNSRNPLRG